MSSLLMRISIALEAKCRVAESTAERFISCMTSHMPDELARATKLLHTNMALGLSLSIVHNLLQLSCLVCLHHHPFGCHVRGSLSHLKHWLLKFSLQLGVKLILKIWDIVFMPDKRSSFVVCVLILNFVAWSWHCILSRCVLQIINRLFVVLLITQVWIDASHLSVNTYIVFWRRLIIKLVDFVSLLMVLERLSAIKFFATNSWVLGSQRFQICRRINYSRTEIHFNA